MMDEKDLLVRYKTTGDMETLGRLYAPYMSLLYGLCFKYLRNPRNPCRYAEKRLEMERKRP